MILEYKGKKWEKEIKDNQKFKKVINGAFNSNEMHFIKEFEKSGCKDYLSLYFHLFGTYENMATYYYLDNIQSRDVIKYTYMSGMAKLITKCSYKKGIRTNNNFENSIIQREVIGNMDFSLFQLIAVEEMSSSLLDIEKENLIMLMYHQKYEQARSILETLPDNPDESKEIYYEQAVHLKQIYIAIIEKNEKKFNEELAKRIKKYRKNMVGYSTIVDIVSVALIKMAKQAGINCTVDVIEIPKQFFDDRCKINKEECKLPYFDDFLKEQLL